MKRLLAGIGVALALCFPALAQSPYPPGPPPPVPALPDSARQTTYTITGTTCACSVGFQLYGDGVDVDSWIQVWVNGKQYLSTDPAFGWSIASATGGLSTIPRPITDAVLTFNNAQTGTVQIVGAQRPRRLTEFSEGAGVPARSLNQGFNALFSIERELWDKTNDLTGRGLFFAPGNTTGPMPQPSACIGAFLEFDSTGLNPLCSQLVPSGNIVAPGSATNGDLVSFNGISGKSIQDSGIPAANIRTKLPVGVTQFYANSSPTACGGSGCSDSNNGLTTGTATKTVLGALYKVLTNYDFTCTVASQSTVQINLLANETNAGATLHFGPHDYPGACAGGSVIIDGGGSFTYEYDSGSSAAIDVFFGPAFELQNITVANTIGPCIAENEHGVLRIGAGVVFANCATSVQLASESVLTFLNNFTISTNTTVSTFLTSNENSLVTFGVGVTGNISGNPTYSLGMMSVDSGVINLNSVAWSGNTPSGPKYVIADGGAIYGGAASIPASGGGIVTPGAIIDGTLESKQIIPLTSGAVATAQNSTAYLLTLANASETAVAALCPVGGTFKNLRVQSTAPTSGQTLTATFRANGAGSSLTCTITGPATSCSDTTHTATCTAGGGYDLQVITSATSGSITNINGGVEFDSP